MDQGASVIGVDCFNDNYQRPQKLQNLGHQAKDWESFDFVPIDLSRGDVTELVAESDVVLHLAAEPGVRSSWGERFEQYVQNNIVATQQLLEAMKASPGKRLVYASSSSIYGDAERFPTPEAVTPRPMSPYGATKLSAEHLCELLPGQLWSRDRDPQVLHGLRPSPAPDMAFHRFCKAALQDETITVFGDGRQTRDFTFVGDIVSATIAASTADVPPGSVYNLGGGSQTSVREALDLIAEIANRPLKVVHADEERGDVRNTIRGHIPRAERARLCTRYLAQHRTSRRVRVDEGRRVASGQVGSFYGDRVERERATPRPAPTVARIRAARSGGSCL